MMGLIRRSIGTLSEEGMISLARLSKKFVHNWARYHMEIQAEKRIEPLVREIECRYRYNGAAPDPRRLLSIDPNEVNYLLSPHFWENCSRFATHIIGGQWDQNYSDKQVVVSGKHEGLYTPSIINFDRFKLFTSARRHFHEDIPWKNTELYELLPGCFDSNSYRRYSTRENIHRTLRNFDWLYEEVKNKGYKTQREIRNDHNKPFGSMSLDPPQYHEVAVNIGRDGELIFDDGRHRFVIAKILKLNQIPTRVFVRHQRWQDLRYEVSKATSTSDLSNKAKQHLDHPDMQDVISEGLLPD